MTAYIEVWKPTGAELVLLDGERVTIGRSQENDVDLADGRVSRLHAVLERVAGVWCVRDLSSRNGTFVNGDRVNGERPLHPGDELLVGRTQLLFRGDVSGAEENETEGLAPPPRLTPRERDVLLALFEPAIDSQVFTEPASTRRMAEALHVSEAAIKQHLVHLYDKFEIYDEGERRRVRLANEALRRGAVSLAEVRARARA